MLIVMHQKATRKQIDYVVSAVEEKGFTARPIPGGDRVSIGVLHNKGAVEASLFSALPGVKEVIPVTRPYKLVSREFQHENSMIHVGDVTIGVLVTLGNPTPAALHQASSNRCVVQAGIRFLVKGMGSGGSCQWGQEGWCPSASGGGISPGA